MRTIYYPSYSAAERRTPGSITLELPKALRVINEALDVHAVGFKVPLPPAANANKFDRAFEALVRATDGEALRARTDDYLWEKGPYAARCSTMNGVEQMIFGSTSHCPWYRPVPSLIREFDL